MQQHAILPTNDRVVQIKKIFHGFPPTFVSNGVVIPLPYTFEGVIQRCVNLAGTSHEFRTSDINDFTREIERLLNSLSGTSKQEKLDFVKVCKLLIADIIHLYTTLNLYEQDGTSPYRFCSFESIYTLNVKVVT